MYRLTLIICLIIVSCSEPQTIYKNSNVPLLNGLYELEVMDSGYKQIWIFSDNTLYTLHKALGNYADERLGISYEASTKFFIEDNLLFECGLSDKNSPITLSSCFKDKPMPRYRIISIDTLYNGYDNRQVVVLEDPEFNDKYKLEKIFHDTIKREINVKLDIFKTIDDSRKSN